MTIAFENYSDFDEWCGKNGYDPEQEIDMEEESCKRDVLRTFYLENSVDGSYASVSVVVSDDWGWTDISVDEGFERKTIITTKNVYTLKK